MSDSNRIRNYFAEPLPHRTLEPLDLRCEGSRQPAHPPGTEEAWVLSPRGSCREMSTTRFSWIATVIFLVILGSCSYF